MRLQQLLETLGYEDDSLEIATAINFFVETEDSEDYDD